MSYGRRIPRKLIISGDVEKGKRYVALADSQLRQLEHEMSFQGLQQLSRTRVFGDVVIQCWVGFGLASVQITTTSKKGEGKKICKACMCGCHVSLGFITVTEPASCITHITDLQQVYDVVVCNKRTKYVELTGCQPMDFTRYVDKEKVYVLWVPDPPTTYADNMKGGCIMEASTWARILSIKPLNGKFDERPCQ